jgi:hypothetical protein
LKATPEERHYAKIPSPLSERENVSREIGLAVAGLTRSGDTIYDYGRDSQVYFYADRSPAIKYFYDRPFWLDSATLDEAMDDLVAAKPAAIVDSAPPDQRRPEELQRLLAEYYEPAGHVAFADLYRRKE